MSVNHYILFETYTQGMALQELLRNCGLKARITPTPRSLQGELSCGMALLVLDEHIKAVCSCIEANRAEYHSIVALECQIQAHRDRFC